MEPTPRPCPRQKTHHRMAGVKVEEAQAVVTQSQVRRQMTESPTQVGGTNGPDVTKRESNLPATDTHGTEMNSVDTPPAAEFPFHEDLLVPATRTRRGGVASGATVCTREELAKYQREDRDVQAWKQRENPNNVVVEDGLLFQRWLPRGEDGIKYRQIVLPKQYRSTVLQIAHSIPLAVHLGRDKTCQRILCRFYWPMLSRDVHNMSRAVQSARKHQAGGGTRHP